MEKLAPFLETASPAAIGASIHQLPDELLFTIFSSLDFESFGSATLTCRRWAILLNDPWFWKQIFEKEADFDFRPETDTDWKRYTWFFFGVSGDRMIGHYIEVPEFDEEQGIYYFPSDRKTKRRGLLGREFDSSDIQIRLSLTKKYPIPASPLSFEIRKALSSLGMSLRLIKAMAGPGLDLAHPFRLKSPLVRKDKFIPLPSLFHFSQNIKFCRDDFGRYFVFIYLKSDKSKIRDIISLQQLHAGKGDWWIFHYSYLGLFHFRCPETRTIMAGKLIVNGLIVDLRAFETLKSLLEGKEVTCWKLGKRVTYCLEDK